MTKTLIEKHGYPSVGRRSLIESEAFKEAMTLNGQDVVIDLPPSARARRQIRYMKYRTVPQFPQIGDKINKAIERVATKQQNGKEAMAQAQAEAVADLKNPAWRSTSEATTRAARRTEARPERLPRDSPSQATSTTARPPRRGAPRAGARPGGGSRLFYWYCLWPSFVVLMVVTLLPTLYLLATSLTPLDLTRPRPPGTSRRSASTG